MFGFTDRDTYIYGVITEKETQHSEWAEVSILPSIKIHLDELNG